MSATPELSSGLVGKWQKRITDALYLDWRDAEFIHLMLEQYTLELLKMWEEAQKEITSNVITGNDPGDEQWEKEDLWYL